MDLKAILLVMIIILTAIDGVAIYVKKHQNQSLGSTIQGWVNIGDDWKPNSSSTPPDVASEPPLSASTYKEALVASGKEGRPVLVMFTASWCTWCKKMKMETLPDPKVKALMANYIFVILDTDQEKEIVSKYKVKSIPAYVITNYKEETLKMGEKYMASADFAIWLNNPTLYVQPKLDTPPEPKPIPPSKRSPRQRPEPKQEVPPDVNPIHPRNPG